MLKQQNTEQTSERTTPYVYYSYEQWGRGYIGSRTAKGCYPGEDYLGSYSDETFKPTDKIILFTGTAEESLAVEVKLHAFFDVVLSPHYANRARQTSAGFTTAGLVMSGEQKAQISKAQTGKVMSDETKQLMSINNCSRRPEVAAAKRGDLNPMRRPEVAAKCKGNKSRTGMTNTAESNARRSATQKGRKVSDETRRRMSEAAKNRKPRKKKTE